MVALEAAVRGIQKDGLVWGASKLVPVGFGIKKLQITLVVEDDKILVSELEEEIQGFEDYVQSTDVVSIHYQLSALSDLNLTRDTGCYAETINRSQWAYESHIDVLHERTTLTPIVRNV
jgi:translation elongation factor EF-1beta